MLSFSQHLVFSYSDSCFCTWICRSPATLNMSLLDSVWSPVTLYLTTVDSTQLSEFAGTTGSGLLSITAMKDDGRKRRKPVPYKLDKLYNHLSIHS